MKKVSKKIILLFLAFVLFFPAVRADATIGNINSFIYSNDYFSGDYRGVNDIAQYFRNVGMADVPKDMDCKLAYLSACYSAKTNVNTHKNLCSTLISNGYQAAIGYTDEVSNTIAKDFEREFYSHLSKGESVYISIKSAKDYMKRYGPPGDAFVTLVKEFGNQGLILE